MISIHQSQFLPWVPYFYKMFQSDVFVILDHVQFQKNGVQNRNQIKTPQGKQWLGVPVSYEFGDAINEIKVSRVEEYAKLSKTLHLNYGRSRYFKEVSEAIDPIFDKKPEGLNDLNLTLLDKVLKLMGTKEKAVFPSSKIGLKEKKDELVIEIIKHFKEHEYLSGHGALGYMDLNKFKTANIKVYVYDFKYHPYDQLWNKQAGFVPELSVIDLLYNDLEKAEEYIRKNGSIKQIA